MSDQTPFRAGTVLRNKATGNLWQVVGWKYYGTEHETMNLLDPNGFTMHVHRSGYADFEAWKGIVSEISVKTALASSVLERLGTEIGEIHCEDLFDRMLRDWIVEATKRIVAIDEGLIGK